MGKIGDYFQKYGISKTDAAKALIYFKTLSFLSGLGTLFICYRYRPLITLAKQPWPKKMLDNLKNRYPTQFDRSKRFIIEKSEKIAEFKYFKPIPTMLGANGKRMTLAIAENFVFYKTLIPILMPLQFWLVIHKFRSPHHALIVDHTIKQRLMDSYDIGSAEQTVD